MATNIPTDLLRAFVTTIDLGSFTRAGEALGRSQPAISQQMRRLEALIGRPLVTSGPEGLALTPAGRRLDPLARQMLRLNDDILADFADDRLEGWLRVGLPTDFSNRFLLRALSGFAASHPGVRVDARGGLSRDLRAGLAADAYDLIVAIAPEDGMPGLTRSLWLRPFWAAAVDGPGDVRPLPLVRHPDPCEYADRMRAALRAAGIPWRTRLVASDIEGLTAACAAGLGVTALTPATLVPGLARLDNLPPLAPLRIGIFYKHTRLSRAGHGLAQWLTAQLTEAGADLPEKASSSRAEGPGDR